MLEFLVRWLGLKPPYCDWGRVCISAEDRSVCFQDGSIRVTRHATILDVLGMGRDLRFCEEHEGLRRRYIDA